MNLVIEKYEKDVDLIYLFVNKNSSGFYPRFGFKPVQESRFSLKVRDSIGNMDWIKLDISKPGYLELLTKLSSKRLPISGTFGVLNGQGILHWYCINLFHDDLYYLPDLEIIVLFKIDNNTLLVYDIISEKDFSIQNIIGRIAGKNILEAAFYFTPDDKNIQYQIRHFEADETLMVRSKLTLPETFKYPITAQA